MEHSIQVGPDFPKSAPTDSLGILVYNSCLRHKNKTLFINSETNETLSYNELHRITCQLACALRNYGLRMNDVIGVCSENSLQFLHPIIAALYLGVVFAPVNPAYIGDELLHVLNLTEPKVVFCSQATYRKVLIAQKVCKSIRCIIIMDGNENVDSAWSLFNFINKYCDGDAFKFEPLALNVDEQIVALMCSSGTTGLPKGVMLTHKNLIIRLLHEQDVRVHPYDSDVLKLCILPLFHAYGLFTTIISAIKGETCVLVPKFMEDTFLACIEKYRINYLWIVPPIVLMLAKSPLVDKYDLSSLKEIVCGAAPLNKNTEEAVKKRLKIEVVRQGYGLTEATLAVIMSPPHKSKYGSSGKVLPGMSVMIRDTENQQALGPNKIGEICIKGPMVMKGYYKNAVATRACFTKDGWLLSGDLAYYDEDGFFFIVDRCKELIKYKGFQIAPAEVEALLLTNKKIKDAAVIGVPNEEAGELPMAFVVKQPGVELSEKQVQHYVKSRLSGAKHLRGGVRFVEEIPKNPSGKILRRKLKELILHEMKSKL